MDLSYNLLLSVCGRNISIPGLVANVLEFQRTGGLDEHPPSSYLGNRKGTKGTRVLTSIPSIPCRFVANLGAPTTIQWRIF